jgi:hypothetical protein
MSIKKWGSILWALAIAICLNATMFGQETTATLVGSVKDSSGGVVPGAVVTITDPTKGDIVVRTVTTNDSGEYTVPNLIVSTYSISAEAPNFKKAVRTGVKVDLGQRRTVDITLEAGQISEVVTVEADPISVDLTSSTSGTVISGDQARELSINNRNWVQLITLAPGVSNDLSDQVYVGTTNPSGQANTVNISVNGARSSQNTFTVDGADVTDRGSNITIQAYPSVDSIGEFRVLRSLYPAEAGRSGGGQINVITRSGTSRFSGSAFAFVRNDAFNANFVELNSNPANDNNLEQKAQRAPLRYTNFGWTLGGPVYFLGFGDREPGDSAFKRYDRTFFFFSQEWRKDKRFVVLNSTVPDAGLRQGVFPFDICLQASGSTCTDVLPAGTALSTVRPINAVAQQYLNFIYNNLPLPTNPADYTLSFPTLNKFDFRQEIFKLDHSFNSKASMYYRYQQDAIPTIEANSLFSSGSGLPGVSTTSTDSPGRTHTAQFTYAAKSNLIFEGRYTYGYGAILSNNVGLLALTNSPIGPNLPYANERDRVPTISGNGFSALQSFGPYDNFSWKQNWTGTVTYIAGSHTMKFGAIYSLYRKNENALAGNNEGIYSGFNTPGGTARVNAPGVTGATNNIRQQWANFLLGTNVSFSQASFDYTADLRQKTFEGFAQDEWRFKPNITLYYGVRYSFFGSPWDKNGRLSNFVPELWDPSEAPDVRGDGIRVSGTGNFCNGLIVNTQNYLTGPANFECTPIASPWGKFIMDAPKTDFAPRVGIAWDPFKKGTTSVRMGYGIYHEQVLNGTLLQQIGVNPPYQQTCSVTGIDLTDPSVGCNVASSNLVSSPRGIQADWKTPYMQHWSLDVQHQLGSKTFFSVGYYGSKGTNLIGGYEFNDLPPKYAISLGDEACAVGASTTPTTWCHEPGYAFFSSAQTTILDQIRPYRGYRSLNLVTPQYNSNYHSMQVSAEHRFTSDSRVNLAYTWSKNLTNNLSDRSHAPQDSYDIGSEYGRAALDRTHIATINYIYELPFFRDDRGAAGLFLGGWQASGIVTFQSGLPQTVTTSSFDAAGLGNSPARISGNRPTQTCNPNDGAPHTVAQWFNIDCFVPNPIDPRTDPDAPLISNVPGSAGRGIIEGPGTKRVDFTLSKNFRFSEHMRLQLRAEAFNLFNWTNPRGLSLNRTSASFGQVLTFRDPRTLQLGAKFYF